MEFCEKSYLHKPVNNTVITLVPKVAQASYAKDFRPTACCTIIYKKISKILTHRMQSVIHEVVNDSQTRFIPDRCIVDNNILLATELIKGKSRKHVSPRSVIKVDIKKAYDSVEWPFLENMLLELGFPTVFVGWIMGWLEVPLILFY